jgi:hypothetical protein
MPGQSTAKAPKSGAETKLARPHEEFEHPAQVVTDPALSNREKRAVLESLEQDAKQMAVASEEGMGGGEATNLRDVLVAKETLELPPAEAAFSVVMQTLEAKRRASEGTSAHKLIAQAIDAINAARAAIEHLDEAPKVPRGAPKPGSEQELEEELAKEKLDP